MSSIAGEKAALASGLDSYLVVPREWDGSPRVTVKSGHREI